jgi:hypothetical protein
MISLIKLVIGTKLPLFFLQKTYKLASECDWCHFHNIIIKCLNYIFGLMCFSTTRR